MWAIKSKLTPVWAIKSTRVKTEKVHLIYEPLICEKTDIQLKSKKSTIMTDIDQPKLVSNDNLNLVYEDHLNMLDNFSMDSMNMLVNLSMDSMNMSTPEESWDATIDM